MIKFKIIRMFGLDFVNMYDPEHKIFLSVINPFGLLVDARLIEDPAEANVLLNTYPKAVKENAIHFQLDNEKMEDSFGGVRPFAKTKGEQTTSIVLNTEPILKERKEGYFSCNYAHIQNDIKTSLIFRTYSGNICPGFNIIISFINTRNKEWFGIIGCETSLNTKFPDNVEITSSSKSMMKRKERETNGVKEVTLISDVVHIAPKGGLSMILHVDLKKTS